MDDREMRLFLSSAESTVAVAPGETKAFEEQVVARAHARERPRCDIYLDGFGATFYGLIGALTVLDERGYSIQHCGGASAGALIAGLVAVGYTAPEIRELMLSHIDLARFFERSSLFSRRGTYRLDYLRAWTRERLAAKSVNTFGDLRIVDSDRPSWRLIVACSDLDSGVLLMLPNDAGRIGLNPDELSLADVITASMAWPSFFEPVTFRNPSSGDTHRIGDGRYLPIFPVWLFDTPSGMSPRWPTFGIRVGADDGSAVILPPAPTRNAVDINADLSARDHLAIEAHNVARTIIVPNLGMSGAEFHLTPQIALRLYSAGRDAAERFMSTWDFDAYVSRKVNQASS